MSAIIPIADPRPSGCNPASDASKSKNPRLFPPNSLEMRKKINKASMPISLHIYLDLIATKMAPNCCRLQFTPALRLSRLNNQLLHEGRKYNHQETRNSWPIIPYLDHAEGKADGLLEERGGSQGYQDSTGPRAWH